MLKKFSKDSRMYASKILKRFTDVVTAAWGLASPQNNGGGSSILLASRQPSACLPLFDLAICVSDLLPEIFSVWLMKLLDIWIGWNPVVRTHIRLRGFMMVRRKASLVVETMRHVGLDFHGLYYGGEGHGS